MTTNQTDTRVSVSFDLRQSIAHRGYKQPDDQTFEAMRRAFLDCLWHEIENHWTDIVSYSGFDFAPAPSQKEAQS